MIRFLPTTVSLLMLATPISALAAAPDDAEASEAIEIEIDPVTDVALLGATAAFGLMLEMILRTGELRPQQVVPSSSLVPIDRWRAESDWVVDLHLSDVTLALMAAYVVTDVALVGALDRGDQWTDYLIVYGETAAMALAVTDLAKIAVRRPRPSSYRADSNDGMTDTALSFFSGHASMAGALAGTATYLAWARGDETEAWVVTIAGIIMTLVVGTGRVLEDKHFPTDVIAGAAVGYAIGVVVPHLHRTTRGGLSVAVGGTSETTTLGLRTTF